VARGLQLLGLRDRVFEVLRGEADLARLDLPELVGALRALGIRQPALRDADDLGPLLRGLELGHLRLRARPPMRGALVCGGLLLLQLPDRGADLARPFDAG